MLVIRCKITNNLANFVDFWQLIILTKKILLFIEFFCLESIAKITILW